MNNPFYLGRSTSIVLAATILLSACATPPTPTPTPEPLSTNTPTARPSATLTPESTATAISTATSIPATSAPTPSAAPLLLSKSPTLILAVDKPSRRTTFPQHVVYSLPTMDKVLLAFELVYYDDLKVDIYYPPDYRFETKLPVVILSKGLKDIPNDFDKDMSEHIDWAKLIAASGMIAVSAQAGDAPNQNSYHVFDFLAANADFLGIDLTHIGYWASSIQGQPTFKALQDQESPYRDGFRAAVFIYVDFATAMPSAWPKNLSLFVVKAGRDMFVSSASTDTFVFQARSSNIPTEYIELADAVDGFDITQYTQASKDTVQQALEFFKGKLLTAK